MIGQRISHYRILEKLGEGGMGVVYKAHDTRLDRDVALKFLPQYLTSDPTEKERFYHEARAAAALTHNNIAVVHEIGEYDNQIFIAMEYVEGKTLKQLLTSEPLPIKKVLDIAIQVCEGLAAAHEKGIVHRDIKSDNIIVTGKGQPKITDFGLAKVKGATKLTKAGSTLGTAAYMSPEQAQGEEVDQRSDIFSFGVVLYEMLTGRLPFRGEHHAALIYSIINEQPAPVARFNEEVTPELEHIVMKALTKETDERYQHADDMLADLRSERKKLEYARSGYVRAGEAAAAQASQPQPAPAPGKKRRKSIILSVAAILAVVILVVIFNPFNLKIGVEQNIASQKPSLAVISFENIPDPQDKEYIGEMLTNLLITALFETKDLRVISRERLYDIQKALNEVETKSISPALASQIARRAGVSRMLLGSILQIQPTLTVTYRVIDVQNGEILSTKRLSGYKGDELFALVDTLALMVKNDLNVSSPATVAKSAGIVTTNSPEAYRAYIEGVELVRKNYFTEAAIAFTKAIDLDSGFVMAHLGLGELGDLGEIEKAWDLRHNATEKEQLRIEARHASSIERNLGKSAEIYEELLKKYPKEQMAYYHLVDVYASGLCKYDSAIAVCERGLRSDSSDKYMWNFLGYFFAGHQRRTEALQAIDRYIQLAPTEPNPYDSKGDVFMLLGEPDSSVEWWHQGLAFRTDYSSPKLAFQSLLQRNYTAAVDYLQKAGNTADEAGREWARTWKTIVSVHKGRLEKAKQEFSDNLKIHLSNKTFHDLVYDDLRELILLTNEKGSYPEMLQYAMERSEELKRQNRLAPFYGQYELAWALLKNGRREESSSLMNELSKLQRPGLPVRQATYEYFAGLFALEQGEINTAIDRFNRAFGTLVPNHAPQYEYAVMLLKSGRIDDAEREFNRMTWWSPIGSINSSIEPGYSLMTLYWPIAAVKARYWLGVAYERQGKNDQAVKEFETFLDIWKDADFKSPEMQDAKARLSKLKGMTGK